MALNMEGLFKDFAEIDKITAPTIDPWDDSNTVEPKTIVEPALVPTAEPVPTIQPISEPVINTIDPYDDSQTTTPKSNDPSIFEDTTAPTTDPSLYSDEGLGVNAPVTSDTYTDHMNSMAQANAQVDGNGNPIYATYSYNPQEDTYTADYSAFGLTGAYATATFTSEQFLADNDRTFSSMEGYETAEWVMPEYAYGVKVSETAGLADALQRQHDDPTAYVPLLNYYATQQQANGYSWNEATQYNTVGESQAGYAAEYADIVAQVADHSVLNNSGAYRNEDLASDGRQALNPLAQEAAITRINDYLDTNNLPLSKDLNGQTVYLNLGDTGIQGAAEAIYRQDSGITDDQGGRDDNLGEFVSYGEIGTYSTIYVEPDNDLDQILNNPLINIGAMFIPFGTAALTAAKAANGQTLHASDWASLVSGGLEASGVIAPPIEGDLLNPDGIGLMGTSYQQTQNIINAAGAGDFTGVISTMVGGDLLGTIGFDEETIAGWADSSGITSAAMSEGLAGILSDVATGESLGDAILNSGVQVLIDDFQDNGALSEALLNGVGSLGEVLGEWGTALDNSVLAPFLDTVGDIADSLPIEEMIEGFSDIAGALTDAVADGLGAVTSGVIGTVGDLLPEGDAYIVNAFDELASATGESIEALLGAANLSVADMMEASEAEVCTTLSTN